MLGVLICLRGRWRFAFTFRLPLLALHLSGATPPRRAHHGGRHGFGATRLAQLSRLLAPIGGLDLVVQVVVLVGVFAHLLSSLERLLGRLMAGRLVLLLLMLQVALPVVALTSGALHAPVGHLDAYGPRDDTCGRHSAR